MRGRRRPRRQGRRCHDGGNVLPGCGRPVWSHPVSRRGFPPAVLRGAPRSGWLRSGVAFPPPRAGRNPDGFETEMRIRRAAEARPVGDPPARVIEWRLARSGPMPTAGRLRSRAASNPPSPVGPTPAGGRPAARAHAGPGEAHHPATLESAGPSLMTSTSSRESFSKARHIATSSQESRGPCSSPVESSTMVKRGGKSGIPLCSPEE